VEVDPKICPGTLRLLADIQVVDGAHVESHKLLSVDWHKNGLMGLVDVKLAFDQIGWNLLHRSV
jgi:hypothetical protein